MDEELKPIGVKITRSEKRDRKIILVIEPDLFSNEVFAVTPFYDEGDKKNQLQKIKLSMTVEEKNGKITTRVNYSGDHYTKGHRQMFDVDRHFINKKDCTLNWFLNEPEKYYTESRKKQILDIWKHDIEFQKELSEIFEKRKNEFKIKKLKEIKERYQEALSDLESAIEEL